MATYGVNIIKSLISSNDASKPLLTRDPVVNGANGGLLFGFDLAFPYSYPGGYAGNELQRPAAWPPTNGQTVYDFSGNGNNGSAVVASTAPAIAGGGFDFSAVPVAANGAYVAAPASVMAALYASQGTQNPQYIICGYFKLPTLANWITDSGVVATIMGCTSGYNSGAILSEVEITQQNNGLKGICQTGSGSSASVYVGIPRDFGSLAQIALYRTNGGPTMMSIQTASGIATANLGTTATTQNYSASQLLWGMGPFWNSGNASEANARAFRLYRGFAENIAVSGRNPAAVLAYDWNCIQTRITKGIMAFS